MRTEIKNKIIWNPNQCRGRSPCDWECLRDDHRNKETLCLSCEVHRTRNLAALTDDVSAVSIVVNGTPVSCCKGDRLIDVLFAAGCRVPTLCHHPLLPPSGACRLCIVEVTAYGKTRIVSSCDFEVTEPISVKTDTPRIAHHRKALIGMLLSEAPHSPRILDLATSYGVVPAKPPETEISADNRSPIFGKSDCIVCGRCVRVCVFVTRCYALDMCGRSSACRPAFPFNEITSVSCTLCGACAAVCPTGAMKVEPNERKGVKCNLCVLICPDSALAKNLDTDEITIDAHQCKECGLCIHYCTSNALAQ